MRLDLVVDEAVHPWRPTPEWVALAEELATSIGPTDGSVELVVTGDRTVQELNATYRDKDRPTDVLSFSYLTDHAPARQDLLEGRCSARSFCEDPAVEDATLVGQILVSVETLRRRGERDGRSLDEEILFLLTHGLLHVLGFDHVEDHDAAEMEAAEQRFFAPLLAKARTRTGGGIA